MSVGFSTCDVDRDRAPQCRTGLFFSTEQDLSLRDNLRTFCLSSGWHRKARAARGETCFLHQECPLFENITGDVKQIIDPMLFQCWTSVGDAGATLKQLNDSCFLGAPILQNIHSGQNNLVLLGPYYLYVFKQILNQIKCHTNR